MTDPRPQDSSHRGRSRIGGFGMPGSKPVPVRDTEDVRNAIWGGMRKPRNEKRDGPPADRPMRSTIPRKEGGSAAKATVLVVAFWIVAFGAVIGGMFLLAGIVTGPAGLRSNEVEQVRCEVVEGTAHYAGRINMSTLLERDPEFVWAEEAIFTIRFEVDGEEMGTRVESIPFGRTSAVAELEDVGAGALTCDVSVGLT